MCILQTRQNIMQRRTLWNWILNVLKYKNEIYEQIELKEWMRKLGLLVCFNSNHTIAIISRKCKKWAICVILMILTLRVNMTIRQMIQFFSSLLWALSDGVFHFCIARPSKFNSLDSQVYTMLSSIKYKFTCQRWHF